MDDPLAALRAICAALPEVEERLSHGEPTWFVRGKKSFVTYANHPSHGPKGRLGFWCAAPPGAQEMLIAGAPERFFYPPYVGKIGWLGVFIDGPEDWGEVAFLVDQAYRAVAPAKLVALLQTRP